MPSDTIAARFADAARGSPGQVAMQVKRGDGYVRLTYADLAGAMAAATAATRQAGVGPGDRVALLAENAPEWGAAYLGIVAAGATAVPIDVQLTDGEVRNLLGHAGCAAAFASERQRPRLEAIGGAGSRKLPVLALETLAQAGARRVPLELARGAPEAPASILYTSGTTGAPKGVVLTHQNFLANADGVLAFGLCRPADNVLVLLPLHHAYAFTATFLVPLLAGARLTFLQSLRPPDLIACLQETRVTILPAVPQLLYLLHRGIFDEIGRRPLPARRLVGALLAVSGACAARGRLGVGRALFAKVHARFGGALRLIACGGARLDPDVARDLARLGFEVLEGYGLTETAPVLTFNPIGRARFGTVGLPLPGVELRTVNPDGEGVGEIAARGANVTPGYYRDPAATAEAIRDGWFHTGDLGYRDAEGYLVITGRAKEVIVLSSGKNIYPEEIEEHYLGSAYVKELCVLGLAQSRAGATVEGLHALVVPDFETFRAQGMGNFREVIRWDLENLSRELPPYRRITGFQLTKDPLPRTRLGKIQRHLVQALYAEARRAAGAGEAAPEPPSAAEDQALLASEAGARVVAYLARVGTKPAGIRPDDTLELDLGLDSLARVEFAVALEQMFGVSLPDEVAAGIFTVREAIRVVAESGAAGAALAASPAGPIPGEPGAGPWRALVRAASSEEAERLLATERRLGARLSSRLSHAVCRLGFRALFGLRVTGLENLPPSGPAILAANHTSFLDGFVLGSALPARHYARLYLLGFEGFFRHPLVAAWARSVRVIPIDSDRHLSRALRAAARVLQEQRLLCVFPEGERSIDGRVHAFRKGIGILAAELEVPVVPVCIDGTFEAWPRGVRWPRPHPVRITIGKPLRRGELLGPAAAASPDPYGAIAAAIREAVIALGNPIANDG
jgi:long-chain acyl-CoA synthetase